MRALAVVRFFEKAGLQRELLSHGGYGEYMPEEDNATEDGRALNRRIKLVIYPRVEEVPDLRRLLQAANPHHR